MALFLGIDLDEKYNDIEVAKRNAFLTEHFSRIVAEANLEAFKEKLNEAEKYD
jgi:Pyruvate/2-oxoacid:ferredoxin oxidoreductase gamma subunit